MFKKEFNHTLIVASGNSSITSIEQSRNDETRENNRSAIKRDKRAHVYHFMTKVLRGGIEYIQFKTKDGIGYCPVANIDSIKHQFDESINVAIN